MSIKILLAGLALSTGCYKSIGVKDVEPPKAPVLVDGEQVLATDETQTGSYHFNNAGDFVQHHYRVGTATYRGEKLSIPRLAAISDPEKWQKNVAHVQELSRSCHRGVVPEYIASGLMLVASAVTIGLVSSTGDTGIDDYSTNQKLALYGIGALAAGSLATYAVGYFRGGSACEELGSFRAEIHIDDPDSDTEANGDEVDLINQLASHFNANHGGPPVAEPAPAPDESSSN
jgi:hypothetical protein